MAMEKDNVIAKAEETLKKLGSINEIRAECEYREKAIRDELSRIQGAREEGETIGVQKGERRKAELTARNLLSMNISIEIISKATGLSIEEINKLSEGGM